MTTDNAVREYRYDIINMLPLPAHLDISIVMTRRDVPIYLRVIGLANVAITLYHKVRREIVEGRHELRYIALDEKSQPWVAYEECDDYDLKFKEIFVGEIHD